MHLALALREFGSFVLHESVDDMDTTHLRTLFWQHETTMENELRIKGPIDGYFLTIVLLRRTSWHSVVANVSMLA